MSARPSYMRPVDEALMIEVEPHCYVGFDAARQLGLVTSTRRHFLSNHLSWKMDILGGRKLPPRPSTLPPRR